MYEAALQRVLRQYGVTASAVFDSQKGYRNEIWPVQTMDGRMINVTIYKREPGIVDRINRADAVSDYLATCGLPTRQRIDPRLLRLKNDAGETYVGVYVYLPGQTIPWEAYTMTHIKLLGQTMSDMHALLVDAPTIELPSVYDEYGAIINRMRRYFSEPLVQAAVQRKLGLKVQMDCFDLYDDTLRSTLSLPGQQALHMDFVRGNVLFDEAKDKYVQQLDDLAISGILDFEKTAYGHPIMDIARTLAFLLVDCKYKSADKIHKYFLYSGYKKRGRAHDIGDDELRDRLVTLFLTYDFYKFLRHNPYESLYQNEHYVRTKDILKSHGVIR